MKTVSYVLQLGFYLSMMFLAAGFLNNIKHFASFDFSRIGILILLLSPLAFIFALGVFFAYKKELKKSLLALILLIVLLGNILL